MKGKLRMKFSSVKRYSKIAARTLGRQIFGLDRSVDIRHMTFELTNLCNSKCEMCHIWANRPSPNILSLEEIKAIFSDPGLSRLEDVLLTGGEMFMRDDVFDIVSVIHENVPKARIFVSTNGILADEILLFAERCISASIPIYYGISIDGLGVKHDKRRRVEGNFDKIDKILIPGLNQLRGRHKDLVFPTIGMCLDDYGVDNFEEVEAYARRHDIPFLAQLIEDFDYYLPEKKRMYKGEKDLDDFHRVKLGFGGANRLMKKEIYDNSRVRFVDYIKKLLPTVHHFRLLSFLEGREVKYECSSLRNFFLLRYDGKVSPCLRFADWVVGDLKRTSFDAMVKSNSYEKFVDEV